VVGKPYHSTLVLERRRVCGKLAGVNNLLEQRPRNNEARQGRAAQSGRTGGNLSVAGQAFPECRPAVKRKCIFPLMVGFCRVVRPCPTAGGKDRIASCSAASSAPTPRGNLRARPLISSRRQRQSPRLGSCGGLQFGESPAAPAQGRPEVTKRRDFTHERTNHELRRACERYRRVPQREGIHHGFPGPVARRSRYGSTSKGAVCRAFGLTRTTLIDFLAWIS